MPLLLGGIVMWSGTVENIPEGWALCNGTNGTLDLRNRFIVGAGSTYSVGNTGGSANAIVVAHTHTGTTNTSANHTHTRTVSESGPGTVAFPFFGNSELGTQTTDTAGNHSHTITVTATGSSGTNANLPPYFALAFIQQIT
jgi:microcystin-dependent protein